MVKLCSDADILRCEPALFGELHPQNQVLAAGTGGGLAGTTFTAGGVDFLSAGVEPGGVIYLRSADGALDGAYEIVAVDSATQLCVSVLRGDAESDAIAPPAGSDISYRVSTLGHQIALVSLRLTEYLGIWPGQSRLWRGDFSAEDILDTDVVRQICAFGVTAAAYRMLQGGAADGGFRDKWVHYEQLFAKGMERARVGLDGDGDGVADSVRYGGCGRLRRD